MRPGHSQRCGTAGHYIAVLQPNSHSFGSYNTGMALPPEVTNHAITVAEMHWGLCHLLILSMILLFILPCIKLKNQDQGCNLPRILYSGHSSDRTGGRCLLPDDLSSVMMMATFVYSAGSENRRLHWHVLISGEKYWRCCTFIIHPVLWLWRKHTARQLAP
ncbi:hypothetical protein EDB84DRAFT_990939 [Lactarius hengduanensis]|nr:hypothetical protein EDB84DRAFT_990939 [Lactarius hengduanensis]